MAFNGFAADLTVAEAARLKAAPDVVNVFEDRIHTAGTSAFPGLSGVNGVWQKHFGGEADAGAGMIIGLIDLGFWPEHPSFAAMPEPRPDAAAIAAKWRGVAYAARPLR
ncbi:protease inhibitor I9 family protein [Nonomuraea lactucae]|uniref:protease inhibitor I9 family protein n=1 Tax=Nonomuraea lactucae TaxID=2249762 RepID=UPI0013B3CA43|nr:protease inhibitor I9 family protein [Nonomuraea lactucae]